MRIIVTKLDVKMINGLFKREQMLVNGRNIAHFVIDSNVTMKVDLV